MKQVFLVAVISLVLYQTKGENLSDLERRLKDFTESEQSLVLEREACPVQFVKVGCYKDKGWNKNKVLNELLFTDREKKIHNPKASGIRIDWKNFGPYLDGLVCRCAQAAKAKGYTHFGAQYYGECLSAPDAGRIYSRDGPTEKCVNQYYQKCNPDDAQNCVGQAHANFVYKISEEGSGGGPLSYSDA